MGRESGREPRSGPSSSPSVTLKIVSLDTAGSETQ